MADSHRFLHSGTAVRRTRLIARTMAGTGMVAALFAAQHASAQESVVGACTGVSLPRSVVTDILSPVISGIAAPTETTVNSILGLPLIGAVAGPLSLNATGLLAQAAAGDPITLNAIALDGTAVGPTAQCRATSDSISLDTPAGIAIGGNRITGLGAEGVPSFAADIDAIAFGNNARAEAGAVRSIALGRDAQVAAANSVALGAGSVATRGALAGYAAPGVAGTLTSAGEVSVGAPGALRQITNVAAGTAATDAATVGQVSGVLDQVAALGTNALQYDGAARDRATLAGAAGTVLANVAPGAISATSSEAVNGAQLFATNAAVDANTGAIAGNTTAITAIAARVTSNTTDLAALDATAVRYDAPDRGTITLGGVGGTTLANVAPGLLSADSTQAVNGAQLFATNAQVAANTTAIAGIGNGAIGTVRYSDAATPTTSNGGTVTDDLTLVGTGAGAVRLHNVADGTVAAGSTDAINGGQLFAFSNQLGLANSVLYDMDASGVRLNRVTLSGGAAAAPVTLGNVAAGTLAADSAEAVNGAQLFATNQAVAGNGAAITNLDGRVTNNETQIANISAGVTSNTTAITNLSTALGNQPIRYADAATPTTPNGGTISDDATLAGASGGPVGLRNVRAGALAAGSTDAVNGDQLFATNTQVAANATAITNLSNSLVGSTVSPVRYSNADTPTTPNDGTLTNDVTLVGADAAAPVALHNVAGGTVSATSTDAVNGQQLFAVSAAADNGVQYDRNAAGARTNRVTLAGGNAAAPVTVANVAAGTLAAGSAEAVNGAQLYATAQVAQQAATLGANSVQYDQSRTSVTFSNTSNTPVSLRNIAAGVSATDAVNVGQLQAGMQGAVTQANAYTDARLNALSFDLRDARRDLGAGTSAGLAAAALPQATEPGRTMIAVGGGTYRGQSAIAFGASTYLDDGHSILRLGATYDSRGYGGANAGYGYQF